MKKLWFIFLFVFSTSIYSQNCSPLVPSFVVDLSSSSNANWISPSIIRSGLCCGASSPDVCVEFIIYLNSQSQGILFDIYSGAVPGGAMFYQINCGPPVAVGQPICLTGPGPHVLTFCKPGNNANQYIIQAIPEPTVSPDITINEGCVGQILTTGLIPSTISINSIYPGNYGQFNSYLSCPQGCSNSMVVASSGYPPYVDYRVCGMIASNCSSIEFCDTVRVHFNSALSVNIQPNPAILCYGTSSLTLTAIGSGGTPPYSFTWNTGQTGSSINVGVGNYTVIMEDATNCPPASASISVTSYPSPIQVNAGADQYLCNTTSFVQLNGTVVSASGGIWNGGQGTFVPSNTVLNPIYYPTSNEIQNGFVNLILTSTGNGSCPAESDTVRITFVPFTGIVQPTSIPTSCYHGSDGVAGVTVLGGFAPYQFLWNTVPSSSNNIVNGLTAGTYTVTITDSIGCTTIQTVTISEPSEIQVTTSITPPTCYGNNDASITLTVNGGTPGYSAQWSNGMNGLLISGIASGSYTCTVTDAKGCTKVVACQVNQPDSFFVNVQVTNPLCFNTSTGSIQLNVSGATPPYSYTWSPSNYLGSQLNNIPGGVYLVTITDSKGCTKIVSVTLDDPPQLQLTVSKTDPTCYGYNNGSANVSVSGGTSPYFYVWSPFGGNQPTANNLPAGNYTVSVYDANGCVIVESISLVHPSPLTAQLNWVNPVSCFGGNDGSASIAVNGGTPPYTYEWLPNGGSASIATSLSAGSYSVSITDNKGCVLVFPVTITQPTAPLSVTLQTTNPTCFGQNNGIIQAQVTGGTPLYNYLWDPPNLNVSSIINLSSGTYQLTITDNKGCTTTASATLTSPAAIDVQSSTTPSNCGTNTGTISLTVNGGSPPYQFVWNPGNYTSQNLINLYAGVYQVTVTDMNNCTQTAFVNVNDIGAPTITLQNIQHVSCFGGNDGVLEVQVNGGTPPYQYTWSPYGGDSSVATNLSAGVFNVSVLDASGCISSFTAPEIVQPSAIQLLTNTTNVTCFGASNGQANVFVYGGTPPYQYFWQPGGSNLSTLVGLSSGTYYVTVTDSKNCTETTFVTIQEPFELQANILNIKNVSCYNGSDGSIQVQVSGGTVPYSYLWSPSNYTGSHAQHLSAGTHTVYITDANGCATSISAIIQQPPQLNVNYTVSHALCNQGNEGIIQLYTNGGTPPYSYQWTPVISSSDVVTNLASGMYYVTVSDSLGCTVTKQIQVQAPTPISPVILQQKNISCFGGTDGFILLGANGGSPPYLYEWSTGQTTPYLSNLSVGTYTCTITDANGCSVVEQVAITGPSEPLQVFITSNSTSCFQSADGTANALVVGGTPPYSYLWVPGGYTSATATGLSSGNYALSVFDANQCVTSQNFSISSPEPLQASVQVIQHVQCYGEPSGIISVNVIGGTQPYSYSWNTVPQQYTQQATNVYAGSYTVTVTDINGCTWIGSGIVLQPTALSLSIISHDVSCYNGSNGTANAVVSGGTPPYSYTWNTSPVQNSFFAQNLSQGVYYVTVFDSKGCFIIDSCKIQQPTQVIALLPDSFVICKGDSITIHSSAIGGHGNYLFYWNNNQLGESIQVSPPSSQSYVVYAFDTLGCPGIPDTCVVIVKEFYPSNVHLTVNSPICPNQPTTVQVSANYNPFDTLYYQWSHGLGPGPGPFIVVPTEPTTYYVTVSNTCHVEVMDSVSVYFKPPPTIYFHTSDFQGCVPLTIQFIDSSFTQYDEIYRWHWNFGDSSYSFEQHPIHTFTSADTFYVSLEVETTQGCINNNAASPLPIYVFPNPIANFTTNKDIYYLPNDPVICTNLSNGAVAYYWNFGDGYQSFVENPTHTYSEFGQYQIMLIATNTYQCADTAYRIIGVSGDILFPNAFTPDQNGPNGGKYNLSDYSNHIFFPISQGVVEFQIQIFNRWGELIFESNDISIGWDGYYKGKLCPQDVYVYQAKATFIDGREVVKKGDVLLIR